MKQDKRDELHEILNQRRHELQTIILNNEKLLKEQLSPEQGEPNIDFNHIGDSVSGDSDFAKEINLIRRERAELALVSGALARFEQGNYGICEDCGEEIPDERLMALPYAKSCIDCKESKDAEVQLLSNTNNPLVHSHDVGNLGL